jgi:IPT/TIG domain
LYLSIFYEQLNLTFPLSVSIDFAHSVVGGPYTAVDTDGDNFTTVALDGRGSHTHRFPGELVAWSWTEDGVEFSNLESPTHVFSVGVHTINLTVTDNMGDSAYEFTTVTVFNSSTPDIADLNPNSGSMAGGYTVQLVGSAFTNFTPEELTVMFNGIALTGPQITMVDATTIGVVAPAAALAGSVDVTVTTPLGTSAPQQFVYIDLSVPAVSFTHGDVMTGIFGPTAVAYGPDRKLYVGTQAGALYKLTLNETYHVVETVGPSYVLNTYPGALPNAVQSILGLAFHPNDTDTVNPSVYVSHNHLFHKQKDNCYWGRITKVSGPTLETHTPVISGLPVANLDHAVNGMDFGDHGELYVVVGSVRDIVIVFFCLHSLAYRCQSASHISLPFLS